MAKSESKNWLRFRKWIAIFAALVGIVGLPIGILISVHNAEIRSLETQHKTEIENLRAAHKRKAQELTGKSEDLTKRIGELEKSLSSLDSVLEKLRELIGDRAKDRHSEMEKILDRNRKANDAIIKLLKEFSKKYPKSKTKTELIQAHFSKYYESLNETMTAYDHWHTEIEYLLIDFRAWLSDRKEMKTSLLRIAEDTFDLSSDIMGAGIVVTVTEEMKEQARNELIKINSALGKLLFLTSELEDDKLRITETTP